MSEDKEKHPSYGPCDGFADGECAECLAIEMENKGGCLGGDSSCYHRKDWVKIKETVRTLICSHCDEEWEVYGR